MTAYNDAVKIANSTGGIIELRVPANMTAAKYVKAIRNQLDRMKVKGVRLATSTVKDKPVIVAKRGYTLVYKYWREEARG